MKKIIEVLRLKHEAKLSHEKIAQACQLSKGVVSKYLSLAQAKGLGWPLPEDTDEAALEALLFPAKAKPVRFVEPDYFQVHQELKRKGVTLQLLWAEYVARHGERAYRYSRFCGRYREWRARQKRSLRQQHRAGEKASSTTVARPCRSSIATPARSVKRVFDLVKDFGTSKSPKSTRSSTTHWCHGRPGHPAFRHNIASSLRLHTGLPYDWTPRSDAPLGSPLAPSARRVSRVASRLPGTTRLRFALHGGQRMPRSLSGCSGPPATHTPRPPTPSHCPTGSARTSAC